jgi:hypothetical protein
VPGFDDRLTRELERAARPAAPDVVRTFSDVTRRRAKRAVVRRVQAVAVVVAVLAGTAGAFALLDDGSEDGRPVATETIAPPYHQMSAWRLQFRPVIALGTTGLNVTCLPEDCTEDDLDPSADVGLVGRDGQVHQLGPAFADASDVSTAEAVRLATGEWAVEIQLDLDATAALEAATEEAAGAFAPRDRIAAVLDGDVVSAPAVQEPITSGSFQVTGLGEEGSALLAAELGRGMPPASPSEPPRPVGEDIGLATRLCDVAVLDGLDLLGDGTPTTAWTGNPVFQQERCPKDLNYVVAVDVTGDGRADLETGPIEPCRYMGCAPLAGSDLDGDGDDELVIHTFFSVIDHLYFDVRPLDGGALELAPILVARPGRPAANVKPGEPLMTSAGGDEGYSSWMRCEGYPDAPVLVWTWAYAAVESEDAVAWHETRLQLRDDGRFHVIETNDFHLPQRQEPNLELSNAPACGIDFNVWNPNGP